MKQALRFTYCGHDYFIEFRYYKNDDAWLRSRQRAGLCGTGIKSVLTHPNMTVCVLYRGEVCCSTKDMTTFSEGRTFCSVGDAFIKEIGRKNALTDALNNLNATDSLWKENTVVLKLGDSPEDKRAKEFVKNFREAAWAAYFARKPETEPETESEPALEETR